MLAGLRNGSGDSRAVAGAAAAGSIAAFGRAVGEFVGKDVAVVEALVGELGLDLGVLEGPHRALADLLPPEHPALLLAARGHSEAARPCPEQAGTEMRSASRPSPLPSRAPLEPR